MSQVKNDRKTYNKKYYESQSKAQQYCNYCMAYVVLSSMPNHIKGKKHVENVKKNSGNLIEDVLKILNNKDSKKSDNDILREVYYLIGSQLIKEEKPQVKEIVVKSVKVIDQPKEYIKEIKDEEKEYFDTEASNIFEKIIEKINYLKNTNLNFSTLFEVNDLEEQFKAIVKTEKDVKIKLLDILQKLTTIEVIKLNQIPTQISKTIDNLIIKEVKVEVKEEDDEAKIERDFITVSKFYKYDIDTKKKHLELMFDNYSGLFGYYYDNLCVKFDNRHTDDNYLAIYKKMVSIKEGEVEDSESEEEEEEEEIETQIKVVKFVDDISEEETEFFEKSEIIKDFIDLSKFSKITGEDKKKQLDLIFSKYGEGLLEEKFSDYYEIYSNVKSEDDYYEIYSKIYDIQISYLEDNFKNEEEETL